MTVKKAKKILKALEHNWDEDKKHYKYVSWNHKGKYFICETHCGQRSRVII
jgi:hypothetical protein